MTVVTAPAVIFIEMALNWLHSWRSDPKRNWLFAAQQVELTAFGDERAKELGASGLSVDFRTGYELGLQTARAYIAGNPRASEAEIDL